MKPNLVFSGARRSSFMAVSSTHPGRGQIGSDAAVPRRYHSAIIILVIVTAFMYEVLTPRPSEEA